jgi:RHS repeat-associated protein
MRAFLSCAGRRFAIFALLALYAVEAVAQQCDIFVEPPDAQQRIHYGIETECEGGDWNHAHLFVDGVGVGGNESPFDGYFYVGCLAPGAHTFTADLRVAEQHEFCGCWETKTIEFTVERSFGTVNGFSVADGVATITVDGTFNPAATYEIRRLDLNDGASAVVAEGELTSTTTVNVPPDGIYDLIHEDPCAGSGQGGDGPPMVSVPPNLDPACQTPGGQCCTGTCFGTPVKSATGNMRFVDSDPLPGLALQRVYDSARPAGPTRFGPHWYSMFDARIIESTLTRLILTTEEAQLYMFSRENGTYHRQWPRGGAKASLTVENGFWVLREPHGGTTRHYSLSGLTKIESIADRRAIVIERDAFGRPSAVSDSWESWRWDIATDPITERITGVTVAGRPDLGWSYLYDGEDLASVVSVGGATWRTYEYGPLLTAVRDPLGNLIESHTFDGAKAISDTSGGTEIASVTYDHAGRVPGETYTETTTAAGAVTRYYSRTIAGSRRIVEVDGSCDCGTGDAVYTHGPEGQVVREQNERGYVTEHTFETGGTVPIQTRTALRPSGCNPETDPAHCRLTPDTLVSAPLVITTATTVTGYEYSSVWPERPVEVRSQSVVSSTEERVEQFVYDDDHGGLLQHVVSGYLSPGVQETHTTVRDYYDIEDFEPRFVPPVFQQNSQWWELAQPFAIAAVDGPRTDAADVTEYVYYPILIPNEYQQVNPPIPPTWRGRLAAIRNAAGHITTFQDYDVWGNAQTVIDHNGVMTELTFDALGRSLTSTVKGIGDCDTAMDPLCDEDLVTSRTFAATLGPVQSEARGGGGVTTFAYDSRGRMSATSRGPSAADLRERIEISYDPASGNKSVQRMLAREGGQWVEKSRESYEYDVAGQLEEVIHADLTSVQYVHAAGGLLAAVRDERHSTPNTSYSYDPAGRVSSVTQMLGSGSVLTSYAYDIAGNLTAVTDPNGNVTSYQYDDFGRMVRQVSPVTGETSYLYDAAGQLLTTTDANGAETARSYDALGRILSAVSSRGTAVETTEWFYDGSSFGNGRLTQMIDPAGTTDYAYDRRGLLLRETRTIDGAAYETSFQNDEDGNRSRVVSPSGRAVDYGFDYAGRPVSAGTGATSIVTSAHYLPFGPLAGMVLGNGTTRTMTFDSPYRPSTNVLTGPGGTIASYTYGHDAAGNITSLHDSVDPAYDRNYGYDDLNRLITANTGSALWQTGTFSYDEMGNITSWTLDSATKTFSYAQTTPRLTSVHDGTPRTVTYDAAGNELAVGAVSNAYSPRNLLASDGSLGYRFDGRGVRTATIFEAATSTILSVTLAVESVSGGAGVNGEILLSDVAPAGGTIVTLSSDVAAATVPGTVEVPAGQASASFVVTTTAVTTPTTATITASVGGDSVMDTLLIEPIPVLTGIAFAAGQIATGGSTTGTVTLDLPASSAGTVIDLSTDAPTILSVPQNVTIAAGETEATFTAAAIEPVSAVTEVVVSAVHGTVEEDAALQLLPPEVVSLTLTPTVVEGGQDVAAEVTLSAPAAAGTEVTFESTSGAAVPPPTVTVPAGATTGQATLQTEAVAQQETAVISAVLEPTSASASLTIDPVPVTLDSITVSPASIIGTNDAVVTVTLTGTATAPVNVELLGGSGLSVEHVPYVTVAAGQTQASIPVRTLLEFEGGTSTIHARHGMTERDAELDILPVDANYVESLGFSTHRVVGGGTLTAKVRIAYEPGFGQTTVYLTSSAPGVVSVPASLTFLFNMQETTRLTIHTQAVTEPTDVTITGTCDGVITRAHLLVVPAAETVTIHNVSVPAEAVGGNDVTATVTLSGPAPAGGASVTLGGSRTGLATLPASVTVPQGQTSANFTITTQATSYPRGVLVTASYNALVRTDVFVVTDSSQLRLPPPQTSATAGSRSRTTPGTRPVLGTRQRRLTPDTGNATRRFYFYTPELNLLAETATSTAATPAIAYEYIWFAGHPVAQVDDSTDQITWYFTDHLGTPVLQTDASAAVIWRVEREPYGSRFETRAGATRHQPLAFPGQEEQGGEVSYNIFRWYRAGWGRYTQSDPLGLKDGPNLYAYGDSNPLSNIDPLGLFIEKNCPCVTCPTGMWYQFGGTLSGMYKLLGAGASLYRFRCPSGRQECDYLILCGKGGVGVFAGLVGGGGVTLFAYCAEELDGWSFTVDFDAPVGSGSAGPGSSGTLSVTVEGGPQAGAASAINVCYSFRLGCRKY